MLLEELLEVNPSNKFHDHEILSADLPEVIGLNDVRVDQVRHQTSFADEVVLELLNRGVFLANQLYRDHLTKVSRSQLLCLVHHSHPTVGNLSRHLIMQLIENVFD